jgi:hypothetical protein
VRGCVGACVRVCVVRLYTLSCDVTNYIDANKYDERTVLWVDDSGKSLEHDNIFAEEEDAPNV